MFELVATNNVLYYLSFADMILQLLFLPLILCWAYAIMTNSEGLEMCHNCLNVLLLIVDLVLTILSVVNVVGSLSQVQGLIVANCLDLTTRAGNLAENALIKARPRLQSLAVPSLASLSLT